MPEAPSFLVDECLPIDVTLALRQRGHDVADLVERGLRGLADIGVWALAASEGRVFVTRDKDFPLCVGGPRPAGLVLLRAPDHFSAVSLAELAKALFDAAMVADFADRVTVASPGRFRQRLW